MVRIGFLFSITLLLMMYMSISLAAQSSITTDGSALLALKSHITSDPHNIMANWTANTSICNWVGVTCSTRHLRVTALNLSYMGLTGTIPPHLGNLSFLIELRFRNNSFHGNLPQELSQLRRLKLISFGYNNFMGTIPSWFGSLSKLQTFDLYGNQFSGSIPTSIFNLSQLQVLVLSNNQLSGSIPREIGNLTMLKEIMLGYNKFEGIPSEIGRIEVLEMLYVRVNDLKGHVPASFFNMSSLTILGLFGNSFNGSLPDNICEHLPRIQVLDFSRNQFGGPLPSKFWHCKELLILSMDFNHFTGSIHKSIGNSTQLKEIYLDTNNLAGTIPDEIGALQNLEILALEINNLDGAIPSTIFNMSMIRDITIGLNEFSGSLPENIGVGIPNLKQFLVGRNKLSGAIPHFISNASMLWRLDLSYNSFSGVIPSTLCALPNLEWVNLEMNNLTIDPEGNIISCLANHRNMWAFSLADNPLNAPLPIFFGNLSASLEYLVLSNCRMMGNIPNGIGNLSSLLALDLGYNHLRASIPSTIGKLKTLQVLYLNDNKLQGYIPAELCQLGNLAELFLGDNQLSGSIPSCFDNISRALRSLSLESNSLTSTIPSTLWQLVYILHLNLSSNSLVGPLPEDTGKLKVVINVDLSNNHLYGTLPSDIGGLQDLVDLSFENNNFEGPIPSSFGNLLSLETLDLSRNNLSGEIPMSLQALLHLKYLNLSFNKLQGEVPAVGPFKNFSAQSFFSNGALCGASRLNLPPCKNSRLKPHSSEVSILKYIIPGILSTVLVGILVWILILRRKRNVEVVAVETALSPRLQWGEFSYKELQKMTNEFNESNLLGTGGFGSVYKGILSDGTEVAVKVFSLEVDRAFKSFDTECEMLSNIRHRNLIKIISCCSQIDFRALVLQYMPNGSLEKWLYSQSYCSLNIVERLNIVIDVALALEYLHHGYSTPIVHCDLKPSNILLDDDMVAHVVDFGIAKLMGGGNSMTQTLTQATIGYMAPEYGMEGIVSTRGDVYSFGIVVMETFTKRKPTDDMFVEEVSLKQWVANSLLEDAIAEVVDADLLTTLQVEHDLETKRDCLTSIMKLALACSAESPEARIRMQDAVVFLNKIKIKFLKDVTVGLQDQW